MSNKRYEWWKGTSEIIDNRTKEIITLDCPDLLNEKDQRIELLTDRWEMLKEFIEKDHDWNLERGNNDCALGQRWVLEKMQELEQEFCE